MQSAYLNPTVIAEWFTFVAALFFLNRETKAWSLFRPLLLLVILAETVGWFMAGHHRGPGNALPFNLLMIANDTFLIWFFTHSNSLQKVRKKVKYIASVFALVSIINLFLFQGLWIYDSYSETIGDITLAILCCYFFFTLLTGKEYIDILSLDYFWLATGVLFYSMGHAILYMFPGQMQQFYRQTHINIRVYINYALNLILYTGFIIAFICRWKTTRS